MSFTQVCHQREKLSAHGDLEADSLLDISPNNVLQSIQDDSILSQIEQGEIERPIARKVLSDRTIYNSRPMPFSTGPPVLCDLGEARVGNKKHRGDIMPGIYRAPEVVLGMDWDSKVDIWAVGVMVSAPCAAEGVLSIYPTKIGPGLELVYENTTPPSPNRNVSHQPVFTT
jgi:serine/threonine protein kinase